MPEDPDTDDQWSKHPAFKYDVLASSLAGILGREREAAFVLGLHGPWGSGKTTLLEAIAGQLPKADILIRFNAWKYQDKEALWRALILVVLDALRGMGADEETIGEMQRSLYEGFSVTERGALHVNWTQAAATAIQITLGAAAIGVGGGLVAGAADLARKIFGQKKDGDGKAEDTAKQVERVAGILQRETTQRAVQHVVSIEQFLGDFRKLVGQLTDRRRVYVLIDDLDRCLPETALQVFEAMKLFLDSPRCAYVVAVDRAVIRRGLELRYPPREADKQRALPPVVDPDEYIEKTITLSVDLPMLSDADGRGLLAVTDPHAPLSTEEAQSIIGVLGTNPRRLKRFGTMLALWNDIARTLSRDADWKPSFSPLAPADRPLFIKLSLIGYLSSGLLGELRRDPELAGRLQRLCIEMDEKDPTTGKSKSESGALTWINAGVGTELPLVEQAMLDPAMWRAFRLSPLLTTPQVRARLPIALRWFRSAVGSG